MFYENIRVLVKLAGAGRLEVPLGAPDNVIPLVSARDVARMAAALLAEPDRVAERAYHLVGAVPTIGELVADFGAALGTTLRYVNVEEVRWREWAQDQGWPVHTIEHLSRLWKVFATAEQRDADLWRVTDVVEQVTGRRPETLREFLRAAG